MERVELNIHTKMSKLNGLAGIEEYINKANELEMKSLALTDDGVVYAFPEAYRYIHEREELKDFKLIYGVDAYLKVKEEIKRITILVKEQKGLKNLYKLISNSYLENFKKLPLITKEKINEYREGLIIGTGDKTEDIDFYDFIEVYPYENEETVKRIVQLKNKVIVATSNPHYLEKEDKLAMDILLDYYGREEKNELYFQTTDEMLKKFAYLGKEKAYEIVVGNTNKIANMCEKIDLFNNIQYKDRFINIENEQEIFETECKKRLHEIYGQKTEKKVLDRYNKEKISIIKNNFVGIYCLAYLICKKAKEDGEIAELRGIGSNSLIAYLLGISYVDPMKYGLEYEPFAGFDGDKEPDFDFNFSSNYQEKIQEYVKKMFGKDKVFHCGTIGVISGYTAKEVIKKYSNKINNNDKKRVLEKLIGIYTVKSIHPGGLLIVPKDKDIYEFTAIDFSNNFIEDKEKFTIHFSYHSLDRFFTRLDLLGHDAPKLLKELEKKTGVNHKEININDKKIIEMINKESDNLFEFRTDYVKKIIQLTKPKTIEELSKIVAISHGTGLWTDNYEKLIKEGRKLSELLCSRDDVFEYMQKKGIDRKISFEIMEFIRKGKAYEASKVLDNSSISKCQQKLETKWLYYVEIMLQHKVDKWIIDGFEKIKYMFPKAHCLNYVIMDMWFAWYKIYRAKEFNKVMRKIILKK